MLCYEGLVKYVEDEHTDVWQDSKKFKLVRQQILREEMKI